MQRQQSTTTHRRHHHHPAKTGCSAAAAEGAASAADRANGSGGKRQPHFGPPSPSHLNRPAPSPLKRRRRKGRRRLPKGRRVSSWKRLASAAPVRLTRLVGLGVAASVALTVSMNALLYVSLEEEDDSGGTGGGGGGGGGLLRRRRRRSVAVGGVTHYPHLLEEEEELPYDYDHLRSLNGVGGFYTHDPHRTRPLLTSTYSPDIMRLGADACSVTGVIMEPRIPTSRASDAVWFALESFAHYAPRDSCLLIQTSSCLVQEQLREEEGARATTKIGTAAEKTGGVSAEGGGGELGGGERRWWGDESYVRRTVSDAIYDRSLPKLRRMIDGGRVRLTFLNHTKYKLTSCSNFYDPSHASMNVNYWGPDEFLDGVDNDLILTIQDDAVLCRHLDVEPWREFAFVGSPWPKHAGFSNPEPVEGMCMGIPFRWKRWIFRPRRYEKEVEKWKRKDPTVVVPPMFDPDIRPICEDGYAPVGNGGLSIRSRSWMVRAIRACPHVLYSGIDVDETALSCKVIDSIFEDFYFATVLPGIGAPMPKAYEASLFSTESLWPEEVEALYGTVSDDEREETLARRWGRYGVERYRSMHDWERYRRRSDDGVVGNGEEPQPRLYTVPLGLHKPWWYHSNGELLGRQLQKECKFLKYLFRPEDSRWKESWERMKLDS